MEPKLKNKSDLKAEESAKLDVFEQLDAEATKIRSELAKDVKELRKIVNKEVRLATKVKKDASSVEAEAKPEKGLKVPYRSKFLDFVEAKKQKIIEKSGRKIDSATMSIEDEIDQLISNFEQRHDYELAADEIDLQEDVKEILAKYDDLKNLQTNLEAGKEHEYVKYKKFTRQEAKQALREIEQYDYKLSTLDQIIDCAVLQKASDKKIKDLHRKYNYLMDKYLERINRNPDLYLGLCVKRIKDAQKIISENGTIVETPYVKMISARVQDILATPQPAFIHGELGSGKTELAKHISRTLLSKPHLVRWEKIHPRPVMPELLAKKPVMPEDLASAVLSGKHETDDEIRQKLDEYNKAMADYKQSIKGEQRGEKSAAYQAAKEKYDRQVKEWEVARQIQAEPLVISGYRQIEIEQILGGISLKRQDSPSPEAQAKIINQAIADYLAEKDQDAIDPQVLQEIKSWQINQQDAGQIALMDKEFERQLDKFKENNSDRKNIKQEVDDLRQAYRESFKNPVETKVYLSNFYRAMQEGRPIILDEINAIPHHVLIMLNDLLTAKPGQLIKPMINDAEPFIVQEGFCVIATGNWRPEETDRYVGRQAIDAAFLSRFGLVKYDYLPNDISHQSVTTEASNSEDTRIAREGNELLFLLLARLLKDDLTVKWPAGSKEKLVNLAAIARVLQDVFSGKKVDSRFYPQNVSGVTGDTNPTEILKENVLSIRHLIPILDRWKKEGFVRPLDDYLFEKYVDISNRPAEKKYIYELLREKGEFFRMKEKDRDGNDVYVYPEDPNDLLNFNIGERMHGHERKTLHRQPVRTIDMPMEEMSTRQVVEMLFGPIPERQLYDPDIFAKEIDMSETINRLTELCDTFKENCNAMFEQDLKRDIGTPPEQTIIGLIRQIGNKFGEAVAEDKVYKVKQCLAEAATLMINKLYESQIIDATTKDYYQANLAPDNLERMSDQELVQAANQLMQTLTEADQATKVSN